MKSIRGKHIDQIEIISIGRGTTIKGLVTPWDIPGDPTIIYI